jgi:orotate phosphoribosyltransferase
MEYKTMKKDLIKLLCLKSFKYSDKPVFKLVSGRMSSFYVNCKPTTLHPKGMYLIGHLVFEAAKDVEAAGIGGLTFGADPIAVSTAFVSELKHHPLKAFSIRKTQKDHGIVKWIEGDLTPGDSVIIIDDVATTGGSTIKAIQRAQQEGMKVVKVIVLVDRQEGGIDNIREYVDNISTIVTRDELLEAWRHLNLSR